MDFKDRDFYIVETLPDGRYLHYTGFATNDEYEEFCGCYISLEEVVAEPYESRVDLMLEKAELTTWYGSTYDPESDSDNWYAGLTFDDYADTTGMKYVHPRDITSDIEDGSYYF